MGRHVERAQRIIYLVVGWRFRKCLTVDAHGFVAQDIAHLILILSRVPRRPDLTEALL